MRALFRVDQTTSTTTTSRHLLDPEEVVLCSHPGFWSPSTPLLKAGVSQETLQRLTPWIRRMHIRRRQHIGLRRIHIYFRDPKVKLRDSKVRLRQLYIEVISIQSQGRAILKRALILERKVLIYPDQRIKPRLGSILRRRDEIL